MSDDRRTTDPPETEAQRRAMGAAMSGHSNLGIPKSVGKEMINADPGGHLPEKAKDVTEPQPASGPMSTKGPVGTKESLPATVEPFSKDRANDAGKAMSLDEIKAQAKRIGRY
jgi:hypothetical protein